jgi:Alpha/beta hydrolase domain
LLANLHAILARMRLRICASFLLLALLLSAPFLHAKVLRVDIVSRITVLNGKEFADAGAYERITGRVYFSLPAANEHNHCIVDLANAVNLRNGEVEFSSDFVAVRPKDVTRGNGSMLLEVPNRGHARILSLVDGGNEDLAHDAGDAWLLRNGYTVVALGWQWDAPDADALRFYAPVARENGKTITGLLRGDLMLAKPLPEIPLGHFMQGGLGGTEYPVFAPEDPRNTLTVRDSRDGPRTIIPRTQWQFAHTVDGKLVPADRYLHLNGGFQPGKIYEYVYVVANPVVAGGGFAAIRDFASYAKHDPESLTPAQRVYGEGISQNGRFLRDFLYQGFNADEQGRIALDGVLAHVAGAGRGSFNYRFAQPSRDAQPTSSVFFPTDIFPFTDQPETDPLTGQTAGLLDRAHADKVTPRIFFSNTSYEYWGRAASLIHVSADGKHDAPISDKVRIYHFTGLQHFSGPWPPEKGTGGMLGQHPESPLPIKYFWRAMIANMDAWVRSDTLPPPSSYPKISDGNLVPLGAWAFPRVPGLNLPHEASPAYRLDYGPNWQQGILTLQPPKVGPAFPTLVPQVDADGNDRDGVRLPEITVPLATYAGWNLRDPSIGAADQRLPFEASYLPFAKTAADRSGDPRKSIAERYSGREDYLTRYQAAVDDLVRQRWILPEDRAGLIHRGEQEWSQCMQ